MSSVIRKQDEIKQNKVIIDPRSFWAKIWDGLALPWLPFAWGVTASMIVLWWPGFILVGFIIQLILCFAVLSKPDVLPIHLPIEANKVDKNDPKPAGSGFYNARGSFYIGYVRELRTEIWVNFKALTQHFFIFGTTGAGKTESIVSYIANFLSVGSGVAFQDAKAAPKAMIQLATLCRIFGRDDDFRVTNYITGLSSERRDPAERVSNDAAIFARGSAESNTQLLVSLMPPSEGDNKIFAERAIALVSAEMPALTDLRDLGKLQIDPGIIRRYMGFKQFMELYRNNNISKKSRDALLGYLESLPGYDDTKEISQQPEEVTRQFGFAQAYFTRALSSLSDTYGHIYLVGQGDIDYQDVVLNGRVLLTLLPSMEKSGDELANLGKIVLTATKNAMVVGLGTVFEGSADDIVHNLPTNSEIPFGIMNDESAYMLVEGQEMANAQGRGLGFAVFTGTQDAPGMLEKISRTTKQIISNSAFKQFMYLDDKETTDLAVELSGKADVLVRNRYEVGGDLSNIYSSKDISLERRDRLDSTAIKSQGLGQAFISYQGKIHPTQVFNHGIQEKHSDPRMCYLSHWYSVRMAKLRLPDEAMVKRLIAHDPRPEWSDLLLMVNDDSRAMLKEMTTYFSSMQTINRITDRFKIFEYEKPTGILKTICENPPKAYTETAQLYALLLKSHETEQTQLRNLGDQAGLDAALNDPDIFNAPPVVFPDDAGDGAGSGDTTMPKVAQVDDPLASFLSGLDAEDDAIPGTQAFPDEYDHWAQIGQDQTTEASEPFPVEENELPKSALASAVERNLINMPWMASTVDYTQTHRALVETERFFNDDAAEADKRVNESLSLLGDSFEYPITQMPKEKFEQTKIFDMLQSFRSSNLSDD